MVPSFFSLFSFLLPWLFTSSFITWPQYSQTGCYFLSDHFCFFHFVFLTSIPLSGFYTTCVLIIVTFVFCFFYYVLAYHFGGREINFTLLTLYVLSSIPLSGLYTIFIIIVNLIVVYYYILQDHPGAMQMDLTLFDFVFLTSAESQVSIQCLFCFLCY